MAYHGEAHHTDPVPSAVQLVRAAYQDPTSQPGLSADGLTQSVVVEVADLVHQGKIVVPEGARLVDRRAWAYSSVVGRQETGIAACSREEQTAPACSPWAAGGVASVEDHRTAVEDRQTAVGDELVHQVRRRQTHLLHHPDHASCP